MKYVPKNDIYFIVFGFLILQFHTFASTNKK